MLNNKFETPEEEIGFLRSYIKVLRREKGELESIVEEVKYYRDKFHHESLLTPEERSKIKKEDYYKSLLVKIQSLEKKQKELKKENEKLFLETIKLKHHV